MSSDIRGQIPVVQGSLQRVSCDAGPSRFPTREAAGRAGGRRHLWEGQRVLVDLASVRFVAA